MADNTIEEASPDVLFVKFADAAVPEFKEVRNKDWILYGDNNRYPEYLTYLYNKSPKHGAIINGKSKYIAGNGFKSKSIKQDFKLPIINRLAETWDEVGKKSIKDVEIYGGAYLMVIWNSIGTKITDIMHLEYQNVRRDKNGGFWYCEDWSKSRPDAKFYDEFDADNRSGLQIFAYTEYRPGTGKYPLPEYLACNNYIETDIEISKFHLSSIKQGMMPSKAIEFFTGGQEPTTEKKKEVERRFEKKFSGAENAGKFMLIFSPNKEKSVNISDLSGSELDKMFAVVNETVQQEIFTGHQVVSPMLFGVKTEGQLGGSNELKTAYEIFTNTYAKPKQAPWERIANYFSELCGQVHDLYTEQLDPVGIIINADAVLDRLPLRYIFEKLNIPQEYWPADAAAPAANSNPVNGPVVTETAMVNDNVKNLTGKQHQQLLRIIRQFGNGKLSQAAAAALLKSGLGLSEEEINALLGVDAPKEAGFRTEEEDNSIIQMFDACGVLKSDFHIVRAKKVGFSSDDDAAEDEIGFFEQAFKKLDVSISEKNILDLISKDKHITPEVIAETLDVTADYVTARIAALVDRGYLTIDTQTVGTDEQRTYKLEKPMREIVNDGVPPDVTDIQIKYSYEGPEDSRNRPFCAKLLKLNRLYSRAEIEQISQRLGYSVFDRRGGFWKHKDGTVTPYCRHEWKSNIVVKKGVGA